MLERVVEPRGTMQGSRAFSSMRQGLDSPTAVGCKLPRVPDAGAGGGTSGDYAGQPSVFVDEAGARSSDGRRLQAAEVRWMPERVVEPRGTRKGSRAFSSMRQGLDRPTAGGCKLPRFAGCRNRWRHLAGGRCAETPWRGRLKAEGERMPDPRRTSQDLEEQTNPFGVAAQTR
jgi:hypothetical protein